MYHPVSCFTDCLRYSVPPVSECTPLSLCLPPVFTVYHSVYHPVSWFSDCLPYSVPPVSWFTDCLSYCVPPYLFINFTDCLPDTVYCPVSWFTDCLPLCVSPCFLIHWMSTIHYIPLSFNSLAVHHTVYNRVLIHWLSIIQCTTVSLDLLFVYHTVYIFVSFDSLTVNHTVTPLSLDSWFADCVPLFLDWMTFGHTVYPFAKSLDSFTWDLQQLTVESRQALSGSSGLFHVC